MKIKILGQVFEIEETDFLEQDGMLFWKSDFVNNKILINKATKEEKKRRNHSTWNHTLYFNKFKIWWRKWKRTINIFFSREPLPSFKREWDYFFFDLVLVWTKAEPATLEF